MEVFVHEQDVPLVEEVDAWDPLCFHLLAVDDGGEPIGCGRLLDVGQIGRMAVRRAWRGQGVGLALVHALCDEARRQGHTILELSAQTQAIPFYERAGFRAYGDVFLDVNIPHRWMRKTL